jgi:O-antigen ligase
MVSHADSIDGLDRSYASASTAGSLPFVAGFYFAFRIILPLLAARILGADPRTGTEFNLAAGFLLLMLVAFCSPGEVHYPLRYFARLPGARWAFAFLAFSGCSLLWSATASPSSAIAYWCGITADVAITILLLRAGPLQEATGSLMKGYVWGACFVALVAWIMPAQSDLRLGDEELLGSNQIGYLCAFAFFFVQYLMRERKMRLGVQSLLLAVTMLRSLSKTTIVAFVLSEGFLLIKDKSMSRRSKILAAVATAAIVAASWSLLTSYFDVYVNAGNQSITLTGRIGLWTYLLAEALQQPWIGHGFDSVWKVIPPFGPEHFEPAHAHNELLQQFYAYGLAGVCMFAGIYGSLYWRIRKLRKESLRTFLLALLIFILVRGLADTEIYDLSLPMWAVVMFSLLIEEARNRDKELQQGPGGEQFPLAEDSCNLPVIDLPDVGLPVVDARRAQ